MDKNTAVVVSIMMVVIFLVAVVVAAGTCLVQLERGAADILQAPGATSSVTVEGLTIHSEDVEVSVDYFTGEVNSKLLDLIILAAAD